MAGTQKKRGAEARNLPMAKKTKIEKGAIQKSGKEVKQRKLVAIEKDERPISKPQQEADATDQETEEVLGNVDSDVESAPVANDEQEGTGDSDDDVVVMSDSSEGDDSSDEEGAASNEKDDFETNRPVVLLSEEDRDALTKKTKRTTSGPPSKPGVVFLGRIPHGFYEKEMRAYFSQFGEVTRLRLSRNKKTGKSKHYAFIEFAAEETAKIVAETMDNYLLYNHQLKCKFLPADRLHPDIWKGANKRFKVIPRAKVQREKHNKPKTPEAYEANVQRLLGKEAKKRQRLEELGIQYEFPGYAGQIATKTEQPKSKKAKKEGSEQKLAPATPAKTSTADDRGNASEAASSKTPAAKNQKSAKTPGKTPRKETPPTQAKKTTPASKTSKTPVKSKSTGKKKA